MMAPLPCSKKQNLDPAHSLEDSVSAALFLLTVVDQTVATSWTQKAKLLAEHQVEEYDFEYILQQASAYVV
jgi:hypothetical protein